MAPQEDGRPGRAARHDRNRGEPHGSVRVRHGGNARLELGPDEVPGVIDELPVLAALATHGGELRVTGAGELRHKESDRSTALAAGLRGLGARISEMEDGFHVFGDRRLRGGTADAAGDHRLAMPSPSLRWEGRTRARSTNAEAVDVSYPGFQGPGIDPVRLDLGEGRYGPHVRARDERGVGSSALTAWGNGA